jgi:hypothetical protein
MFEIALKSLKNTFSREKVVQSKNGYIYLKKKITLFLKKKLFCSKKCQNAFLKKLRK